MEDLGPDGTGVLNILALGKVIDSSTYVLVAARNHLSVGNRN